MRKTPVICVCGAGTMGSGITQLAAQAGFNVIQFDVQEHMVHKSRDQIIAALDKQREKGRITDAEQVAILERIVFTHHIDSCKAAVFIEAIIEKEDAKIALLQQLAALNDPSAILASNTSSISISKLAAQISHPGRVAGMHFFNPAPVMKLVEIVRGTLTSEATLTILGSIAAAMNKTAVICKDSPGFIVNRVARPYYLESLRLAEQQLITPAAADRLLEATGFKMGPFRLMDMIGMDVNYAVSQMVWQSLGSPPRLQPSPLQEQKLAEGALGRKTGKGFYDYN